MGDSMKIGIDLDGTLADYQKDVVEFLNFNEGKKYRFQELKRDDCYDILGNNMISRAIKLKKFYRFSNGLLNIKPVSGAQKTIKNLKKRNYQLYIVTSRFIGFSKNTLIWLEKNFEKNTFEKIIFSKILASYATRLKIRKYRKLGINIIIEDSPYVAKECSDVGMKVLLIERPWNKDFKYKNVKKVKDWKEIDKILNR